MTRFQSALALLVLSGLAGQAAAAVVENLRTYRAPDYTRLVFEVDDDLEHRIFTLDGPDRVVIDLADSSLQGDLAAIDLGDTPVARIRSAARNDSDLRVVFDLRHKVKPRSFMLEANEQYGKRLVVDLYDDQPVAGNERKRKPLSDEKRDIVVAISAGHGGEDPGAIGVNRLQEKQVVLAIAREVEQLINALPGYRAVMIRDGDYYVGLRQRVLMAHKDKADLYLSIHADAHENHRAHGSTIYALSQRGATSEQARLLAEKENSADLIGGVGAVDLSDKDEVLASVLLDLSMNATVSTSLEIGDNLISVLNPLVRMRRTNVEQAAFVELKSAGIPSLLIETGYITNADDARNLDSPRWRHNFARALVSGVTQWFVDRPPPGTLVAWQKANGGALPSSYTVTRGDTLSQIAARYGIATATLKELNGLQSNTIRIGQVLKLPGARVLAPPAFVEHTISRGETLSHIAVSYSVSLDAIREANQLDNDRIRVGQVLKIPAT